MMQRRQLMVVGLLGAGMVASTTLAEDLQWDKRIKHGQLSNGIKWMYRQHDNPPGKMALMVNVKSGSMNETEAQRGLAHFIEHMAFNGTEHYPPGKLLDYFESIGMEFGADLNAFTSFDQTAYMLFLPDTKPEQVDKGLMTLSDYVFRALMLDGEINKERGVVMEEWRRGQSAQQRIFYKMIEEVYAGSHIAKRIPIGLPEVIEHAPTKEFKDYYATWYRPELMTVMLVGDAPPEPYLASIENWFGKEKAQMPARKPSDPGIKTFGQARAFVFTDPEYAGCEIELSQIQPVRAPRTTVESARQRLRDQVGTWIVNRRLDERVQKGEASYRGAYTYVSDFFQAATQASGSAEGEPEDWAKMLEELVIEVNRAKEHGMTERELALARKELLAGAERAVETESTRSARSLLMQLNGSITREAPVTAAAQELELMKRLLPELTISEVNESFQKHFGSTDLTYVVMMPEKDGVQVPTTDDVLVMAKAAQARRTEPIKSSDTPEGLLAMQPTPGKIVEEHFDEDLQITTMWLENGTCVHHRFMDYKKDQVLVSISLAGGKIEETKDSIGLTEAMAAALSAQPATSRLTSTNIRDLMTGVKCSVNARPRPDAVVVSVRGAPADLGTGLQLVNAILTDGQLEESAINVWKQRQIQQLMMAQSFPEFKAFEALIELFYGGDPRQQVLLPKERVEAISTSAVQHWFDQMRNRATLEVAVVGEISKADTAKLVTTYLGSLPSRPRTATYLDGLRTVKRPVGPMVRNVEVQTMTPKGMAIAGFVGVDEHEVYDLRAMTLASNILTSRLIERIREELSLVYSIRAGNRPGKAYHDSGIFVAQAPCEPGNVAKVVEEAHGLFQSFATDGPSDEELANAKKQIANNLDEEMREPRYWLRVLQDLHYHGKKLADEKIERTAYEPYTVQDVVKVFRKYYTPARQFMITAAPAPAATETEKNKESAVPVS